MGEAGVISLIGALVAILNPFGPGEMAIGARLAYWIGGFLAAWVLMQVLAQVGAASAKLFGLARLWGYAFAIPFGAAMIAWALLWWQGGSALAFGENFSRTWPSTILVGMGFFALFYVIYARAPGTEGVVPVPVSIDGGALENASESDPAGVAGTRLHERLPAGFPPLIALSVEDHYVRAHAEQRSELVLITLAEATALMPSDKGMRVHRGWWVAKSAVRGHRREGRDVKLSLASGIAVPVSRNKVASLREAG
jgi:hypothetical protein